MMIRMRATQAFKSMEGAFAEGAHFLVNAERALALKLEGKAERAADQTDTDKSIEPPSAKPDAGGTANATEFGGAAGLVVERVAE